MENRSTVTNLTCITQYISNILDKQGQVDVIYTDIQKAFDHVDHFLLLTKLDHLGFSSNMLSLIKSYLMCRRQFVEYGGFRSDEYLATSGVPQGSNLGPLLFLIFINDLSLSLNSHHLLFADDLKIYMEINSINDCICLQNVLNTINQWCSENFLNLNISKCKLLSFHRKQNPLVFHYSLNDNILDKTDKFKDLGVIFDSKFTFSEHITQIIASTSKTLGFFVRNWNCFTNINTLKLLYVTFIRSKLEYCAIIWSPLYQNAICSIESVQRKCLKYMFFKYNGHYPERGFDYYTLLTMFNIDSLHVRRNSAALKFLYKLLHDEADCPLLVEQISFLVPRLETRQQQVFFNRPCRSNVLLRSPLFNMSSLFNKICFSCDIHQDSVGHILSIYKKFVTLSVS